MDRAKKIKKENSLKSKKIAPKKVQKKIKKESEAVLYVKLNPTVVFAKHVPESKKKVIKNKPKKVAKKNKEEKK